MVSHPGAVTGKVLRFDSIRGYGFIAPDSGGPDVFLHANDLLDEKDSVRAGAAVEFRVEDGGRGLKASDVRLLEAHAAAIAAAEPRQEAPEFCDVLSIADFRQEITEALLAGVPSLTGSQLLGVRREVEKVAVKNGWVEG